jgi:Domain of unknown function (DUF1824)
MGIAMSTEVNTPLTVGEASTLLKQFNCQHPDAEAIADPERLRQALLLVAQHSDYQILGICADTFLQAWNALEHYAKALGYSPDAELSPLEGAVYLKFNPNSGICYVDAYTGAYRGVLVACQSAYDSGINDMYGHLPLDLFKD